MDKDGYDKDRGGMEKSYHGSTKEIDKEKQGRKRKILNKKGRIFVSLVEKFVCIIIPVNESMVQQEYGVVG